MDELLPWIRRSGWAYLLLAFALAVLAWRLSGHSSPASTQPQASAPARVVSREPTEYLVHVAGAVKKPGVYRIGGDGRVIQAIRLAGGPKANANLAGVNLAAPVQDGQQVIVPERIPAGGGAGGGASPAAGGGPVSLSSATAEQLDGLDGIGPTLAARIVAWRTEHGGFASIGDLLNIPGIGQTRLDAIRAKLTP